MDGASGQAAGTVGDPTTVEGAGPPHAGDGFRALSEPARRLLEAADELFYERGAVATTVREITSACGLSPGALYNHFPSKDELLFVLVRDRHLRLEEDLVSAQAAVAGDPVAELTAIIGVYVRAHVGRRRGAQVANREFRHLSPDRLAEVVAIRRRLRDRVAAVIRDGQRHGVFELIGMPEPASTTIAASTILDMCVHSSQWLREDGAMDLAQLERFFVATALRLVGCPGGG